ncbi:MAG: FAD-dependent oxidoreductase [Candidatus Colwellbacteria bacterium]|nr:FAD-dependent oxidoreductase [Candidatus Colwellbacteria bacterium]
MKFNPTLTRKFEEAPNTFSFFFEIEGLTSWQPGQFLRYTLPHDNPDDRRTYRWFTISSVPHEGVVRLTTRLAPESSTFKQALFDLPIGSVIEAEGPKGDFTVDNPVENHIFIAGGVGITPYRAILLDLEHRGEPLNITLLYMNGDQDFVFKPELDRLAKSHPEFKVKYFISPEQIEEEDIRQSAPDLQKPIFYLSGPEPMVEVYEKTLLDMGVPNEHIKLDYFPGYE